MADKWNACSRNPSLTPITKDRNMGEATYRQMGKEIEHTGDRSSEARFHADRVGLHRCS
jgi:hypothetical protein